MPKREKGNIDLSEMCEFFNWCCEHVLTFVWFMGCIVFPLTPLVAPAVWCSVQTVALCRPAPAGL